MTSQIDYKITLTTYFYDVSSISNESTINPISSGMFWDAQVAGGGEFPHPKIAKNAPKSLKIGTKVQNHQNSKKKLKKIKFSKILTLRDANFRPREPDF